MPKREREEPLGEARRSKRRRQQRSAVDESMVAESAPLVPDWEKPLVTKQMAFLESALTALRAQLGRIEAAQGAQQAILEKYHRVQQEHEQLLSHMNADCARELSDLLPRTERPVCPSESPILTINVGGQLFTTRLSTLCAVPGSFLEAMFSGRFTSQTGPDGHVFIDRHPRYFEYILSWLRDPGAPHELPFKDAAFVHEVSYYGLKEVMLGSGTMHVIGGDCDSGFLDSIEVYDSSLRAWRSTTPLPFHLSGHGCAVLQGKLHVVGGVTGESKPVDNVLRYDPETAGWTHLKSLQAPRTAAGVVAARGCLWAVGGFNGDSTQSCVDRYDPTTNTWEFVTDLHTARHALGCVTLNGKIYAIGGQDFSENDLDTVEAYDLTSQKWSMLAPLQQRRSGAACAVLQGKIYAVGGLADNYLNSVEMYDPETNCWQFVTAMTVERNWAAVCCIGGKLVVAGGDCNTSAHQTVECFDPTANTWSSMPPMKGPRCFARAIVCENIE